MIADWIDISGRWMWSSWVVRTALFAHNTPISHSLGCSVHPSPLHCITGNILAREPECVMNTNGIGIAHWISYVFQWQRSLVCCLRIHVWKKKLKGSFNGVFRCISAHWLIRVTYMCFIWRRYNIFCSVNLLLAACYVLFATEEEIMWIQMNLFDRLMACGVHGDLYIVWVHPESSIFTWNMRILLKSERTEGMTGALHMHIYRHIIIFRNQFSCWHFDFFLQMKE